MKFYMLPFTLALTAVISSALKIDFRQAKRSTLQRRGGGENVSVHKPTVLAVASNLRCVRHPHPTGSAA